jgi:selenocysteine lyase/cysteine desulfurase
MTTTGGEPAGSGVPGPTTDPGVAPPRSAGASHGGTPSSDATPAVPSALFEDARQCFPGGRGYLAAAAMGLPPVQSVEALRQDLDLWAGGRREASDYVALVERTRSQYARLVQVPADRVAIGSQTSVLTSLVAAAVPPGAEVLVVDGDFSSMVFPFLQRHDITVRHVPVEALASSITDATWVVAFSLVQSATGVVADSGAIAQAAARHGAFTFCDTTQAAGVLPVDAAIYDATVCHAYKWLCSPRGVAFLTVSPTFQAELVPLHAGWYAGSDIWQSCYGPGMTLAADARVFDVSPAWQAWVGAEQAIALFADLEAGETWRWASGLGDSVCDRIGIERQGQAIVTWPDPDGRLLGLLGAAGIRATGRAGRLRLAFHLWNDEEDVESVVHALR